MESNATIMVSQAGEFVNWGGFLMLVLSVSLLLLFLLLWIKTRKDGGKEK